MAGYDEISLTSPTKVYNNSGEYILQSEDFGFKTIQPDEIKGGESIADNAKLFLNILENNATEAQKNVVLANSALALKTIYPTKELKECVVIANESLESKRALNAFKKIINLFFILIQSR